jgi:hypothetical protein
LTINETAERLLDFRRTKREQPSDNDKKAYVSEFVAEYLSNFQKPEKNVKEYTDNMIRYLRLTKYIHIRGGGYYIDLEPRRMVEINAILEVDNGSARVFANTEEYKAYISDYNAYPLPFETVGKLTEIVNGVIAENTVLAATVGEAFITPDIPTERDSLKDLISDMRERRALLQNLVLRQEYQETARIESAITALNSVLNRDNTLINRPSVELEKWANVALNIINDATLIKPNAPLGDDNEPTFTAPAGVPDIECYYDGFGAICEVTMLTGRDQWYNEGQPVMRHLRSFETANAEDSYCLFIAPRLHSDTINTFWTAVKYEYEGQKQRIVPITITGLISILRIVKEVKSAHHHFSRTDIRRLYDMCVDISNVANSTMWSEHIGNMVEEWRNSLVG